MAWHQAEADTSAFVAQCAEEVHDMADERVFSTFALNRLQAKHWIGLDWICFTTTHVLKDILILAVLHK